MFLHGGWDHSAPPASRPQILEDAIEYRMLSLAV
jgi:hypothetical protein